MTRQRLHFGVHLSADPGFRPIIHDHGEIASVEIIDGLVLQSDDPGVLRSVASAFLRAAESLEKPAKASA